jgi:signal transduction histidine kinase
MTKPHGPSPERTKTDESLREERDNTDDAIRGDRKSAERVAEAVVGKARAAADALVSAERKKADGKANSEPARARSKGAAGQRATADRAMRGERASADVALRSGLEDRTHALEALLVHERAATDAYLLTERVRSDDDVANRDDFLGMVAHDVRNLLHGVILNLEVLAPAAAGEADAQRSAARLRIRRDVARMSRLIGDLVDVASIDAGKLAMAPSEGDAVALVKEAADTFQAAAREKGVTLAVEVPAGPLAATFDYERILQVLANLVANAIKFTPREGGVTVRADLQRGRLRLSVDDTGVGIPPGMRKAIFERFWQVGKDDRRGMGLGLYISKCIVDAHGGRIWAESNPGKGTRIVVELPLAGAPVKRKRRPPSRQPAPPRRRKSGALRRGRTRRKERRAGTA